MVGRLRSSSTSNTNPSTDRSPPFFILEKRGFNNYLYLKGSFLCLIKKGGTRMRKMMLATVLVLAVIFGYAATRSIAHEMMSRSEKTSETTKLLGASVKNPGGEDLGTIADVVTGPEGRVAFAVLSYWISDDTQKRIAVPFGALSCEEQNCVLNVSREALDSAPTYVSEDDLVEPKLAEDIYRYFGIQPYWTGEETQK
jgi:hypothetical protein